MYPKNVPKNAENSPKTSWFSQKRGWWYFSETLKTLILLHLTEFFWLSQKHSWKILLCCEANPNSVRAMTHILLNSLWPSVIKFRFYCSKIRDFKVYTKICAKLKTSKNFFFKVLLFCLLAILFCPLTFLFIPTRQSFLDVKFICLVFYLSVCIIYLYYFCYSSLTEFLVSK